MSRATTVAPPSRRLSGWRHARRAEGAGRPFGKLRAGSQDSRQDAGATWPAMGIC
jgi:hypothetical protein